MPSPYPIHEILCIKQALLTALADLTLRYSTTSSAMLLTSLPKPKNSTQKLTEKTVPDHPPQGHMLTLTPRLVPPSSEDPDHDLPSLSNQGNAGRSWVSGGL